MASPGEAISRKRRRRERRVIYKAAITIVLEEQPEFVTSCRTLLQVMAKYESRQRSDIFPREFYVISQVTRSCVSLHKRIKSARVTCLDFREEFTNLACVCDYMTKRDGRAATRLKALLSCLVKLAAPLAGLLEVKSHEQETNWESVGNFYANSSPPNAQREPMVPKISYLRQVKIIGAGGFGSVYHVLLGTGITLTAKIVHINKFPTINRACIDKVVGCMVNSPFIVKYYAAFTTNLAFLTLMEYIRGVDLHNLIMDRTWLPEKVVCFVLAQIAVAVNHMHSMGFIHRDIKPSNVIILPGCRIKLIDFDTSKLCSSKFYAAPSRSYTRKTVAEFHDKEAAGTPSYFAPEVFGGRAYGRAIDWWSLGVSAFRISTGRLPFRGYKSATGLQHTVKCCGYRWPQQPKNLSDALKNLIERLLVKDANLRLCSSGFAEFVNHEYYSSFAWEKLSNPAIRMNYTAINKLMRRSSLKDGKLSPVPTAVTGEMIRAVGLPSFDDLVDAEKQPELFLFCSSGINRSLIRLQNKLRTKEADILEISEDLEVPWHGEYKFAEYLKYANDEVDGSQKSETSD